MLQVLGAVAEYERSMMLEKTTTSFLTAH